MDALDISETTLSKEKYMRIIHITTFLTFLWLLQGGIVFSEPNDVSIILRNGAIVTSAEKNEPIPEPSNDFSAMDRFVKLKSLNISGLTYTHNNKIYKLDWHQILKNIESIELWDPDLSPYKDGKMRIKKISGETLKISEGTFLKFIGYDDAVSDFNVIEYDSYHKFWRDKYLDIREVRVIRFRKEQKTKSTSANGLNFASTSEQIVSSLSKPKYNEKKETGVNLNIEFDFNSHKLRRSSYSLLNELGRALTDNKLIHKNILIKGHTDSDGPKPYNQKLSLRRAKSVRTYLVSKFGISPSRLTTAGYGETSPLVPNISKANKQINRRVEIRANL